MTLLYRAMLLVSILAAIGFAMFGFVERQRLTSQVREVSRLATAEVKIAKLPDVSILKQELTKSVQDVNLSAGEFRSIQQDIAENKTMPNFAIRYRQAQTSFDRATKSLTSTEESPILKVYSDAQKQNEAADAAYKARIASLEKKMEEVEREKSAIDFAGAGTVLSLLSTILTMWLNWRKDVREERKSRQESGETSKKPPSPIR